MPAARALLLGWGNATKNQLVAYERLHASLGMSPRSLIPDTKQGVLRADAYARALAPVADDLAADGLPTIVHVFSDNGFIGWAALLEALASTDRGRRAKESIRGVIMDSSPGLWAVQTKLDFARRFALAITPAISRSLGLGARERLPALTPALTAAFVGYQVFFPHVARSMKGSADRVARAQPRCPHLFLYGGEDILVPPENVRAWIERQRAAGIDVLDVPFPTARHVALYPQDPRRYRSEIGAFVRRVLER